MAFEVLHMAIILILQEGPGPLEALRKSLQEAHDLHFVSDLESAMSVLEHEKVNLIISRVHLEQGNVFDFIRHIKTDSRYKHLPLLCFCGKRTELAKTMDRSLAKAVRVFGADGYICLDHFCSGDSCDFEGLRREIESVLA
jgi:PleD family two-component response regulator